MQMLQLVYHIVTITTTYSTKCSLTDIRGQSDYHMLTQHCFRPICQSASYPCTEQDVSAYFNIPIFLLDDASTNDCASFCLIYIARRWVCRGELQKAEMKGSYAEPEAAESLRQSLEREMKQQVTQMEVCSSQLHCSLSLGHSLQHMHLELNLSPTSAGYFKFACGETAVCLICCWT